MPIYTMPYRKKRAYRKKRPRRYRRKAKTTSINRASAPFPDRMLTRLRYTQAFTMTNTTVASYNFFRGNDLYDPDATGAGHQPLGFDNWSAIYTKWLVRASRIDVQVIPITGTQIVTVRPCNTSTQSSGIMEELEKSNVRYVTTANTSGARRVSHYATARRVLGQNIDRQNQIGTNSASPTTPWHWLIEAQDPDQNTSSTCRVVITLTYYCAFFHRQRLTQS